MARGLASPRSGAGPCSRPGPLRTTGGRLATVGLLVLRGLTSQAEAAPSGRPANPAADAASSAVELPFWLRVALVPVPFGAELAPSTQASERTSWLRQALDRTRQGSYDAAAKAYLAALAAGAADPAVITNLAEVLMADGRLGEAEARYRDAIAVASATDSGDPRALTQDLALAYYGLAVALDRDEQPGAAREMMGRALALDPPAAVLKVAALGNGDLFFVPDGEAFYYLALAASVAGRRAEAVEDYRQFLTRAPGNRWIRLAERHIVELTGARAGSPQALSPEARSPEPRPARGPRLVATGTVLATGGLAAPLLDAAWRDQAAILDDCLDTVADLPAVGGGVRFAIELDLDARGRVAGVNAKVPSPPGEAFARCLESAVKTRLHLRPPAPARATHARTEFIIGFPSAEGAGYR
jgi:tetratricopeptide (TPR) repeat protein